MLAVQTRTEMAWDCPSCKTRIRIEYVYQPTRTGAMSTVDCPLCGANKMVPDVPERIFYRKDGSWMETKPHTSYIYRG